MENKTVVAEKQIFGGGGSEEGHGFYILIKLGHLTDF